MTRRMTHLRQGPLMEPGYWLMHDRADDAGFDWSLWRWNPDSPLEDSKGIALDEIVVGWSGEPRAAGDTPGAAHEEGFNERWFMVSVDEDEAAQLVLGAHHGVFYQFVDRLLLARSIDPPPKQEREP